MGIIDCDRLTPRERMIAALTLKPVRGRIPDFELVFFLAMEAVRRSTSGGSPGSPPSSSRATSRAGACFSGSTTWPKGCPVRRGGRAASAREAGGALPQARTRGHVGREGGTRTRHASLDARITTPKEKRLVEIVKAELAQGRSCCVFVNNPGHHNVAERVSDHPRRERAAFPPEEDGQLAHRRLPRLPRRVPPMHTSASRLCQRRPWATIPP